MLLLFGFMMAILSCQESRDQQSPGTYRRDVGQAIPTDVAYRWVKQAGGSEARSNTHALTAVQLHTLLPGTADFVGVTIHNALDESGIYHVLVTPLPTNGTLWASNAVWDATARQWTTTIVAQAWTTRYSESYPAKPLYHFFGSNLFDTLLADISLETLEIVPATNDNAEPQLLLFAWSSVSAAGRVENASLTVYDASRPCPPCSSAN